MGNRSIPEKDQFREIITDAMELLSGRRPKGVQVEAQPPSREAAVRKIADEVLTCMRCPLASARKKAVPGYGVLDPLVMVIGEAPGAEEDRQGLPFVGAAGKYLDKWLAALGLTRGADTFIGNIIKCRPPGNRDPYPEEQQACIPYLKEQIACVRPKTILCVGRIASQILLDTETAMGRLRGTAYQFEGIPLVVTYHPSAVLRNPEYRRPVWDDLKLLQSLYAPGA